MGYNLSWVAVQGVALDEVLRGLGFERGTRVNPMDDRFDAIEARDGWIVVQGRWGSMERQSVTHWPRALRFSCSDWAMSTALESYVSGQREWSISHDDETGTESWQLPGTWEQEVRRAAQREEAERASDPDEPPAAWVYDLVTELGHRVTGYRHHGAHDHVVHEIVRVAAPTDLPARFFTVGNGDEQALDELATLLAAIPMLDAGDAARRSLRLDVRVGGRRRTMLASFEFGELRVVAWASDGRALATRADGTRIDHSDLPALFASFYDLGQRSPAYLWNPAP